MRKLKDLIRQKSGLRKPRVDEKSLFYVFSKIIGEKYGSRGLANLKPDFLKKGKLFVKAESSAWANELWLSKEEIAEKINKEIGQNEILEIKLKVS